MVELMSCSYRRGTVAVMMAVAALLLAAAALQPAPTPFTLASNGTINIGTQPPT
jgi:hypothetical protein